MTEQCKPCKCGEVQFGANKSGPEKKNEWQYWYCGLVLYVESCKSVKNTLSTFVLQAKLEFL